MPKVVEHKIIEYDEYEMPMKLISMIRKEIAKHNRTKAREFSEQTLMILERTFSRDTIRKKVLALAPTYGVDVKVKTYPKPEHLAGDVFRTADGKIILIEEVVPNEAFPYGVSSFAVRNKKWYGVGKLLAAAEMDGNPRLEKIGNLRDMVQLLRVTS